MAAFIRLRKRPTLVAATALLTQCHGGEQHDEADLATAEPLLRVEPVADRAAAQRRQPDGVTNGEADERSERDAAIMETPFRIEPAERIERRERGLLAAVKGADSESWPVRSRCNECSTCASAN